MTDQSPAHDPLYKIRHSMAHVLAQAVKSLYPQAKLGFGPPTTEGFYYDFDFSEHNFSDGDLKKIQAKMKKLLSQNTPLKFEKKTMALSEALEICDQYNEPYKREYVQILADRQVKEFSFFSHGNFLDLCEGPHVTDLSILPKDGFKLDRASGAYWLGDHRRPMLTRIYAICFATRQELDQHIKSRELAARYDHKKLGKELELFCFEDHIGKGLPIWLPAGEALRSAIANYIEEVEFRYGYSRVRTPVIAKKQVYETSGHLQAYGADMFPMMSHSASDKEDKENVEEFFLRPMNCPHHHMIYRRKKRSFKELPVRYAELGDVFRFEKSGELSGLLRVRCFAINDAHIYCRQDQILDELHMAIQMQLEFFSTFNLSPHRFRLSMGRKPGDHSDAHETHSLSHQHHKDNDAKFFGDDSMWNQAQEYLVEVMEKTQIPYDIAYGEAAFYGPKIDTQFRNLAGREETLSTVQLDFLSAEKFDLSFQDTDGQTKRPIIIHRAPLSSLERLISLLIEYYRGVFPLWCAPTQVAVIPVHEDIFDYAYKLKNKLTAHHIRTTLYDGDQSFGKKISLSIRSKTPVIAIVGHNELHNSTVSLRLHGSEHNTVLSDQEFLTFISEHIQNRSFHLSQAKT